MASLEIFPTCYYMDHRTIPIGATCRFCKSPPYRDTVDASAIHTESVTPASTSLSDPPVSSYTRLPHRPSIMVPDTTATSHPPALGLASSQIRRSIFPRQRNQLLPRIQSSTPTAVDPPPSPAEIKYHFAVALAIGHWPSEDALECRFTPLENKTNAEIGGNKDLVFSAFMNEFLDAVQSVPIQAAFRYDRGNWRIAMNYKSRQTPLTFLPYWTGSRIVNDIMRSWPHKAAVYPVTICWEPSQDQTPSEHPWDAVSFRSSYPPEVQQVEENESTPQPHTAVANHKRGISDVTTRSEREQEYEKERPAARYGGRRVGASELEGLGIEVGEEAQGASEGRVTRTRKIRAPRRAPGDELQ